MGYICTGLGLKLTTSNVIFQQFFTLFGFSSSFFIMLTALLSNTSSLSYQYGWDALRSKCETVQMFLFLSSLKMNLSFRCLQDCDVWKCSVNNSANFFLLCSYLASSTVMVYVKMPKLPGYQKCTCNIMCLKWHDGHRDIAKGGTQDSKNSCMSKIHYFLVFFVSVNHSSRLGKEINTKRSSA